VLTCVDLSVVCEDQLNVENQQRVVVVRQQQQQQQDSTHANQAQLHQVIEFFN